MADSGIRGATLPPATTAARLLSPGQRLLSALVVLFLGGGLVLDFRATATFIFAGLVVFYLAFALFKVLVTIAGRAYRPLLVGPLPSPDKLPDYAVLLPVHKEANMLRRLMARIADLQYPRERLHVYLLIEHDDAETLAAARALRLRFHGDGRRAVGALGHVTVLVVPPGGPKTKPNALNMAVPLLIADGCRYLTIYDAEDRPAPDQLLKAVATFRMARRDIVCLQAELAFWNDDTNWISALYWIAYKVHFRRFLPGLTRLGLPIPLGGTSNHFKVDALVETALPGGLVWDPHNLTEDADLGARLTRAGYRADILGSVTLEEAPVSKRVVDKQQRRWKGGYIQTGLVHTRRPLRSAKEMGPHRWFCFILLTLGTPLTFLVNPIFLALTVGYFVSGSDFIAGLFPTPVYYTAATLFVLGNFITVYELVQTCIEEATQARGRFGLIKYMFAAQVMWLWMSRSTYIAAFELLIGKRAWHKTPHGHDETDEGIELPWLPESAGMRKGTSDTNEVPADLAAVTPARRPVAGPIRTVLLQAAAPDTVLLPRLLPEQLPARPTPLSAVAQSDPQPAEMTGDGTIDDGAAHGEAVECAVAAVAATAVGAQ